MEHPQSKKRSGTIRWCRDILLLSAIVLVVGGAEAFAQYRPPVSVFRPYGTPMFPGTVPPGQIPRPQIPRPVATPVSTATPPAVSTHQRILQLASEHPFCIVVGETFASRILGSQTVDEGPFEDFLMGAQLKGVQKTRARTYVDFTPDVSAAKILYVLKGVTANDTVAQLPQASVRSAGTFHFEMTKQIEFNGESIRTWSPSAFMTIKQENIGAATTMSHVPLLGPLANNIVLNVAEQRKPISEGIAAQRVTQQIAPKFNSRLDEELAKLNQQLHGPLKERIASVKMTPSRISTLTTDDAFLCGLEFLSTLDESDNNPVKAVKQSRRTRTLLVTRQLIPGPSPLSSGERIEAPIPYSLDTHTLADRACVLIHASLVQNLADRFGLGGREIPDTQLSNLFNPMGADGAKTGPQMFTVILDEEEPIQAFVDHGELIVEVRMSIRPIIGPEIPTQAVRISVRPQMSESEILLDAELVSVEPVNATESNGAKANPMALLIRQAIEQRLNDITIPRDYLIPRQEEGKLPFPIRIQNLTLVDGWITATIESPAPSLDRSTQAELDVEFN